MSNFAPDMSYPLFLARKLSLGAEGRKASPAVRVAVAAVALSVVIMIAAVSIVLGFKREIREKVRGFNSDITLYVNPTSENQSNLAELTPLFRKALLETPGVTSVEISISSPAIFKTPDDFKGIYLKSALSPQTRRFLSDNMESGRLPDFESDSEKDKIVISRKTADQLELKTGSKIETYFITDEIRVRKLEVAGIYNSHFDAYDNLMVYGSRKALNELNALSPSEGTSILISTDDFDRVPETAATIQKTVMDCLADGRSDRFYKVQTAREAGAGYFNWLAMLDVNVIVILSLMMAVGCVTLVSGMLIIILDKRRFIGTLKALGSPTLSLRRVFVLLAIRIALTGLIIGDLIAIAILWAQDRYHFIPLDGDAYYMDFVPVELIPGSILTINAGVLLISYFVLILPSRFVAKISPAETMRDGD